MKGIVLNEKNVRLNVEVNTWEEAIRFGGNILVTNGCVKESYVDGIIASIKQYGPYIIIAKGLAIPHTRPEDGAVNIGFSLITLKKPIYFEGDTEPVKVMISFCAIDSQTHLDILKMIVDFVEKGYIEPISKMNSLAELLALVEGNNA